MSIAFPSRVLVTGGTGSFGTAFAQHVLATYPDTTLTLYSRSEYPQVILRRTLACYGARATFMVGDVRDSARLIAACRGQDAVVHAAALKHIAIGEEAPFEAIQTNILGTNNVLHACAQADVSTCVVLSSDKAVAPENLYGVSKFAAERLTLVASRTHPQQRYNLVRYGNVMGSRGSVLEVFQRLLAAGQTCLPITDLEMTRFFMTIPDAVSLVELALNTPVSGYTFVPNLAAFSLRVLAQALLENDQLLEGIDYRLLGIQPGEKLHETLLTTAEQQRTLLHRNIVSSGDCYAVSPHDVSRETAEHALQGWQHCVWQIPYSSDQTVRQLSPNDVQRRLQHLTNTSKEEAPGYVSHTV